MAPQAAPTAQSLECQPDLGESRSIKEKLTRTLRPVLPEALLSLREEEDGSEKHVAGFSDELCSQH